MKTKLRILPVLLLVFTIFGFHSFSYAIEGNGQEPSESNNSTEVELNNKQKLEEQKALAKEKYEQAKQKAQEALDKKKEMAKTKSLEQRQKACQNLSSVLGDKLSNRQDKAVEFKTKLDGHLAKITNFVEKNNLEFADYKNLVTKTQSTGMQAQAQIDSIVQYKPNIECSNPEKVSESVSSFKESLAGTKESLKTYRDTIKQLLTAVKQQASEQGAL